MNEQIFRVEKHARHTAKLIRRVTPQRGKPYEHRCPLATFERVCELIDQQAQAPFVPEALFSEHEVPASAGYACLAFLEVVGIVERASRQWRATTDDVHLDAMIEFWSLLEEPQADPEAFDRNAATLPIEVRHG